MSDIPPTDFGTASGLSVSLTADERRLALLWLVDFERSWDALELATTFVVDGPAKLALIQDRLGPLGDMLAPLAQRVDALEMLVVRHWFRNGRCAPAEDPHGEQEPA